MPDPAQTPRELPEVVPHMVTRYTPAGRNLMAGGAYVEPRAYEEQNGWKCDGNGLHAWSMTRDGARRMYVRMAEARAERERQP